jgi:hypothetical protein
MRDTFKVLANIRVMKAWILFILGKVIVAICVSIQDMWTLWDRSKSVYIQQMQGQDHKPQHAGHMVMENPS